jgi:hypothetical protein
LGRQTIPSTDLHRKKTSVSTSDAVANSVLHYCHISDLQCKEFMHKRKLKGFHLKTVISHVMMMIMVMEVVVVMMMIANFPFSPQCLYASVNKLHLFLH